MSVPARADLGQLQPPAPELRLGQIFAVSELCSSPCQGFPKHLQPEAGMLSGEGRDFVSEGAQEPLRADSCCQPLPQHCAREKQLAAESSE